MLAPSRTLMITPEIARGLAGLRPMTRLNAVEIGMTAVSSVSSPARLCPLAASSPITVIGMRLTRISCPTGL